MLNGKKMIGLWIDNRPPDPGQDWNFIQTQIKNSTKKHINSIQRFVNKLKRFPKGFF